MEQTEINEGNKLIAIFMGADMPSCQKDKDGNIVSCTLVYNEVRVVYIISAFGEFKFHISWDWLMPVIEKISKIPVIEATENSDTCYPRTFGMLQDDTGLPMFRFNCCHLYVGETLIEAAWIAVVEFIKSENNLKK
jgi:hypothetical protein